MPFFSTKKSKSAPVFAGLDDPFNFPATKMSTPKSHHSRSPRTSSPDSGYASIDESLSPKSQPAAARRRLKKDSKGHWRMGSYEYQSEDNDVVAERTPILEQDGFDVPTLTSTLSTEGGASPSAHPSSSSTKAAGNGSAVKKPDNEHVFKTNPRRTFTQIVNEPLKKKQGWFERRVYGRALQRREKSEGVSELQREMAPVLRRASPERELEFELERGLDGEKEKQKKGEGRSTPMGGRGHAQSQAAAQATAQTTAKAKSKAGVDVKQPSAVKRPVAGQRKGSTLLHPSPPPSSPAFSFSIPSQASASSRGEFGITTTISGPAPERPSRGRSRKPSTLLHPSPPPSFSFPSLPPSTSSLTSTPLSATASKPVKSPTLSCFSLPSSRTHSPHPPRSDSPPHEHKRGGSDEALRSPRHRSPTPLRIPTSSARQPAPTPLRIRINFNNSKGKEKEKGKGRKGSVLHSCFSEDEDDGEDENGDENEDVNEVDSSSSSTSSTDSGPEGSGRPSSETSVSGVESDADSVGAHQRSGRREADAMSVSSVESAAGTQDGILARTGLVARAQRIRLVSSGSVTPV